MIRTNVNLKLAIFKKISFFRWEEREIILHFIEGSLSDFNSMSNDHPFPGVKFNFFSYFRERIFFFSFKTLVPEMVDHFILH